MKFLSENAARDAIVKRGQMLRNAGLTPGSSGNISIRLEDSILVTPTNSRLGELEANDISKLSLDGDLLSGMPASKEAYLHLGMLKQRPSDTAVVHLHSTHSVGLSCMDGLDVSNVLPPLTAYYVMRVGKLPLLPYFPPGALELAEVVAKFATRHHALLLSNHGPVVSGSDLDAASCAIEEIEETAKLHMLLENYKTRPLTGKQVADINDRFKS